MMQKQSIIWSFVAGLIFIALAFVWHSMRNFSVPELHAPQEIKTTNSPFQAISVVHYEVKKFDLQNKLVGLSDSQINQHKELYAGYVNKRNEIAQKLQTVDHTGARNRTYSPYRALKLAETYALNGSLLHELYFEIIGKQNSSPGPEMMQLINDNFGSLENYKKDLLDAGGCSRGWAVTAYGLDDHKVHTYVLEEHNTHVPVLAIPLLVLDVYEHAYMIDFGIKRDPYLDVFWNNIDWDVVEERIKKWIKPFIHSKQ